MSTAAMRVWGLRRIAVGVALVAALAGPARAQTDEQFLAELRKQGFTDLAVQFAKDHPAAGAAAEALERLGLLEAEIDDRNTAPKRRAAATQEAMALLREVLKAAPPTGKSLADQRKQLAYALLQVKLARYLLVVQGRALFQNAEIVGLGAGERKRLRTLAEEGLAVVEPAHATLARILKAMENDDRFDDNWGEQRYIQAESNKNVADFLLARARMFVARTLRAGVVLDDPTPDPEPQRRQDLLEAAGKSMEQWSRKPRETGVLYESIYSLGVIRRLAGRPNEAIAALKAAMAQEAPVVVRLMARASLVRTYLEQNKHDLAGETVDQAIQWARDHRGALGPNAEFLLTVMRSYVLDAQSVDAGRRGQPAREKQLHDEAMKILSEYSRQKPELKPALYDRVSTRLMDKARKAAKEARDPASRPALLKPEDPDAPPASRPADEQPIKVVHPEADILPKPAKLHAFELAAMGARMLGEKPPQYDAARWYFEALIARKDDVAAKFHDEALFNLAISLYYLGKKVESADRFIELAETNPKYPRTFDGLDYAAEIYVVELQRDATNDAVRAKLERALRLLIDKMPPSDEQKALVAKWRFRLGWILQLQKKYLEAAGQYDRVQPVLPPEKPGEPPRKNPDYYDARFEFARCHYYYVGQLAEAKQLHALRPACLKAIDAQKRFSLFAAGEARRLEGTEEGAKIASGTKNVTVLDSRINEGGEAELRVAEIQADLMPPGYGETRETLVRKAIEIVKAFPARYPRKAQRRLLALALGMLIDYHERVGEMDKALEALEKFKKDYPEDAPRVIANILDALVRQVDRLEKAGAAEQAVPKAKAAAAQVESQIQYVRRGEKDPAARAKSLYDLKQRAAGLWLRGREPEKAVTYFRQLIFQRQLEMARAMLAHVQKNITDDAGLLRDCTKLLAPYAPEKDDALMGGGEELEQKIRDLEGIRNDLARWVGRYYLDRDKRAPDEFLDPIPEDAVNYKGIAQAFEALGRYDAAKKYWWKLHEALPGPSVASGSAEAKEQWWESGYYAIRCDLLAKNRKACELHLLRIQVWRYRYPYMGGPEWKAKFAKLEDDLRNFLGSG
jgi:tetratricopeptide (TPR) repeat protein